MNFNKKVLGILFIAVVVVMLIINLIFFAHHDKKAVDVVKDEPKQTVAKEKKPVQKDPLEETKKATVNLYRDKITPVGTGKEYPKTQTGILKNQLLELAEKGDYGELLKKANAATEKNKFSKGDNLDIAGIIYDAGIIADIYGKETDKIKYGEVVATSKTPEMLVLSTLFSDNFQRRPVIDDVTSIAPIGFQSVEFGQRRVFHNSQDAKDEPSFSDRNIAQDIFASKKNVNEVFAFDITIPDLHDLPVTAYVWEDLYGNLKFYGMYAPDDFKTYEHSLQWYMNQDKSYENAEKEQEKNYEEDGEKGVITEDQVDKLFDSGY